MHRRVIPFGVPALAIAFSMAGGAGSMPAQASSCETLAAGRCVAKLLAASSGRASGASPMPERLRAVS